MFEVGQRVTYTPRDGGKEQGEAPGYYPPTGTEGEIVSFEIGERFAEVQWPDGVTQGDGRWVTMMANLTPVKGSHGKPVIYVSGPTEGVPEYWLPFEDAEFWLMDAGYLPLTTLAAPHYLTPDQIMPIRLAMLEVADAALFLPGWDNDRAARLEHDYCRFAAKPYVARIEELRDVLPQRPD